MRLRGTENRSPLVTHPLHVAVGTLIAKADLPECAVVRDPACGGNQNIPLFCDRKKSNSTEYCDVDIIILKEKTARVIVEIEEANVTPVQVCGKFLASALSSYFIHQKWGSLEMGDSVSEPKVLSGWTPTHTPDPNSPALQD